MRTLSESDTGRLDAARIVDLDLGGETMRQGALRGICAQWGSMPPFYVINNGLPQAVVGRATDVREVLSDRDRFTAQPPSAKGYERFDYFNGAKAVSQMDGKEHDRVRATIAPSFGPRVLVKIDEAVRRIVDKMLDEVQARGGPFDCMTDFADHLIVRILLDGVLGLTLEQQLVLRRMHEAFALVVDIAPGETYPDEYMRAQQAALQAIADIVAERRVRPRELDFISAMIAAQAASGVINDEELVANIFAITAAGQGTTLTTTGAMLMNLCKHRDQFDQLIADRSLIAQTVEESLRYQGPGFFTFPRFATRDCDVGGVQILEGMPVNVSMQAANFDPLEYPDPLTFNIHRKPRNITTFSVGSHHCIGNRLARQVLVLVLDKVCARFPNLRLQNPNFEPHYGGMYGELKPDSIPMHTGP